MSESIEPELASALSGCKMAVVFTLDQSGSMTTARVPGMKDVRPWTLQVDAHTDALNSERVLDEIEKNLPMVFIARSFDTRTHPLVNWKMIHSKEDALSFASELASLRELRRYSARASDISVGIDDGINLMGSAERQQLCPNPKKMVIDVSTDGANNIGNPLGAIGRAESAGITVNSIGIDEDTRNYDFLHNYVRTREPLGIAFHTEWSSVADMMEEKFLTDLQLIAQARGGEDQEYDGSGPARTPTIPDAERPAARLETR